MSDNAKPPIKKIKATGAMKKLMADYFGEIKEASETKSAKIAWCTSVGPAELLRSFGFQVYFPENHGALLGATRAATDLIPAANAIGNWPITAIALARFRMESLAAIRTCFRSSRRWSA